MSRVQANYQPIGEQLRRTSSPQIALQQAPRNNAASSNAARIAESLGLVTKAAGVAMDEYQKAEEKRAFEFANSISQEDLRRMIRDKEILPSESPIFAATLENIYGQNAMSSIYNEVEQGMKDGTLNFADRDEFDQYLVQRRDEALSGMGNFVTAGFDKRFVEGRTRLNGMFREVLDQRKLQEAKQSSSQLMANVIAEVTSEGFKDGTEAAVSNILSTYQLARNSITNPEEQRKLMFDSIASLAQSGQRDIVAKMLDTEVSNGLTVRSVVGLERAESLRLTSEGRWQQAQMDHYQKEIQPFQFLAFDGMLTGKRMEEARAVFEKYKDIVPANSWFSLESMQRANEDRIRRENLEALFTNQVQMVTQANIANIDAALGSGTFRSLVSNGGVMGLPTKDGGMKEFPAERYALQILDQKTQGMDIVNRIKLYASNGLRDEKTFSRFAEADSMMAEIALATDSKKLGQLDPQVLERMQEFRILNEMNPAYMESVLIKDRDLYERLDMAATALNDGRSMSAVALGLSRMQNNRLTETEMKGMDERIRSAVDDLANPSFWAKLTGDAEFFDERNTNTAELQARIKRFARFSVMAGFARDAKEAVEMAQQHFEDQSVDVGGTRYLKSQLPKVPDGSAESPDDLFERWQDNFKKPFVERGYDSGGLRFQPFQGGFILVQNGIPVGEPDDPSQAVVVSMDEIEQQYAKDRQTAISSQTSEQNLKLDHGQWLKRYNKESQSIKRELPKLFGAAYYNYEEGKFLDINTYRILKQKGWDQLPIQEQIQKIREFRRSGGK